MAKFRAFQDILKRTRLEHSAGIVVTIRCSLNVQVHIIFPSSHKQLVKLLAEEIFLNVMLSRLGSQRRIQDRRKGLLFTNPLTKLH